MIGYIAQRLMPLEAEGQVGAGHGERGEGRENWRKIYSTECRDTGESLTESTDSTLRDRIRGLVQTFPGAEE